MMQQPDTAPEETGRVNCISIGQSRYRLLSSNIRNISNAHSQEIENAYFLKMNLYAKFYFLNLPWNFNITRKEKLLNNELGAFVSTW
jgi:hypothetical protein